MATIRSFEEIDAWNSARELSIEVHKAIDNREWYELAGIKEQIYKSAGSVMDNIAEGFDRDHNNEFQYFLAIAKASCSEVRSQVYRLYDFNLITHDRYKDLLEATNKTSSQIGALMRHIKRSNKVGIRKK